MQDAAGNVTRAAKIAGKDRRDFGKLLKKHGLTGTFSRRSG
jgi:DNA-binding protein Fis